MRKDVFNHFNSVDQILSSVLSSIKPFTVERSDELFFSLVESIISQQLSVKAGDTIVKRFLALFPNENITPEQVLSIPRETLRSVGMSWSKADYVHNISRAVVEKDLDLDSLENDTDEEIIKKLTKIKGIGRWTAEMFLMFTMAREDVFSYGDVGLQNAIQKLYKLKKKPTQKQMEKLSKKWKPYRTYAARILWRSLDNEPDKE